MLLIAACHHQPSAIALAATAPGGVSAERNGTEMVVSWRRLTLVEARGFVQYYIINISGGIGTQQNRQQSGAGGVCNATHSLCLAPESASSVTVTGLEPSSSYAVTVAAASGVQSPPRDLPLAMEEGEVLIGEQSEPVTVSGGEYQLQYCNWRYNVRVAISLIHSNTTKCRWRW